MNVHDIFHVALVQVQFAVIGTGMIILTFMVAIGTKNMVPDGQNL